MPDTAPASAADADADTRPTPQMRVFEVTYTDGTTRKVSAHLYDIQRGALVFIDEVKRHGGVHIHFRRSIAAGQWREIEEVSGGSPSNHVAH